MKYLLFFVLSLLPLAASAAVTLSNCDRQDYDVIVRNGENERVVHMTGDGPPVREYGPTVSFEIKDKDKHKKHREVHSDNPFAEYCIWHGEVDVQRLNTFTGSGGSLR